VPRRRDAVVRRGMRHVGRAIVEQPGMFALAFLATSLYGGMTVASAYVLGEVTDRVVLPALDDGVTSAGALALAAAAILGVAVLKILGILGRRTAAGSPASTCGCRCPGTSATRPGSCCPTPTPTSRRPGSSSRRCPSPAARS
jgi:hypothetical protein